MTTLVFDGHNLLHRAMHGSKHAALITADGVPTGGVYTSLRVVRRLIAHFGFVTEVYVVFDGSRSARRRKIYPAYKEARKRTKSKQAEKDREHYYASFHKQRLILSEAFTRLGCKVVRLDKREGDDIIYQLLTRIDSKLRVIITEDDDFYQLVDSTTQVYKPIADKLVHIKNFEERARVPIDKFILVKSIIGDKDEAPGVSGVGIKSVLKIINEVHDIPSLMIACEGHKDKRVASIANNMDSVMLGLELVDLAKEVLTTEEHQYMDAKITAPTVLDIEGLKHMLRKLEFMSLLKDFESWVSAFRSLGHG